MSHWMVTLGRLDWCVSTSFCTRSFQLAAQSQYWNVTGAVERGALAGATAPDWPHAARPSVSAAAPPATTGLETSSSRRDTTIVKLLSTAPGLDAPVYYPPTG